MILMEEKLNKQESTVIINKSAHYPFFESSMNRYETNTNA